MHKGIVTIMIALFLGLCLSSPVLAEVSKVEEFFWSRQWTALEQTVKSAGSGSSARDRVMYANALWLQGKWAPALEIFLEERSTLPEKIRPFADMLITLGFERTGNLRKAREVALSLWNVEEWFLSPYVAYALGRIALSEGNESEAGGWFRAMAERAQDSSLKRQALEALIKLPGPGAEYALALLEIAPFHKGALKIIREGKVPEDLRTAFPLGYAAFFSGDLEQAARQLGRVPAGDPLFGRASFFRARSLARLGRPDEAIMLWKGLAMKDSRYWQSSVESISRLASEGKSVALGALSDIASSGPDDPAAASISKLAEIFARKNDDAKATALEQMLLERFPKSRFAASVLWDKGWTAWKHGDTRAADSAWMKALEAGNDKRQESRLLYWAARASARLGDTRTASSLYGRLKENHPIDYYTFLAFPEGLDSFTDSVPKSLSGAKSELADWGFVIYARMELAGSNDPGGRFAAARLALWMGDARGAFMDAAPLAQMVPGFNAIPGPILEALYPKAREREVLATARRFGVDPLDVWSIMRRESAFDEEAASPVGAMGLMQLMPPTARENAKMLGEKEGDYFDPARNILLGTHHFSRLLKMFDRIECAIAAYNAGQGSVGKWLPQKGTIEEWIEDIPFGETREFVRQVMANRHIYRMTYPEMGEKEKKQK
ncbi:MAG: transglycosylase SLT domain-containing protein [Thermovirgaceae bacterium]|nr:transglycosylase SLT domain-containing protein [Thermovirgaceae bacterium]